MQDPIIRNLTDTDWYKLLMQNFAYVNKPNIRVKYRFINRTKKVQLAKIIPIERVREELNNARLLSYKPEEIKYLSSFNLFSPTYLRYLETARLPDYILNIKDGQFEITTEGLWYETIQWETFVLSIINELYSEVLGISEANWEIGFTKLKDKINLLEKYPEIKFSEFGTRRRASREWQFIVDTWLTKLKTNLTGISNIYNAWKLGVRPSGTFAHEIPMIYSGIYRDLDYRSNAIISHDICLSDWFNFYGPEIAVGLTDTYGSDFFFRNFGRKRANEWQTLRQDSGDPFTFGEKAILFYKGNDIDPMEKTIIFSDGLDLNKIIKIHEQFKGRIKYVFGWGTNLTNDIGLNNLQIVFKADVANGYNLIKLSDNIYKATGDLETIEIYKNLANYNTKFYETQNY